MVLELLELLLKPLVLVHQLMHLGQVSNLLNLLLLLLLQMWLLATCLSNRLLLGLVLWLLWLRLVLLVIHLHRPLLVGGLQGLFLCPGKVTLP